MRFFRPPRKGLLLLLGFIVLLPLGACSGRKALAPTSEKGASLTLFFTTDEHGHIAAREKDGRILSGAANLAGILAKEGFRSHAPGALLLSGGDSWTGPAVSTFFKGESTVAVFNALGYDAAALGNHDLDFGQEVLAARAKQAAYPILAANVRTREGTPPRGVVPFVVKKTGDLKVGIIGIANPSTPRISVAENIAGLRFGSPAQALSRAVPLARAQGAQLILGLTHLCGPALLALAPKAATLGVAVLFGGHCHEQVIARKDGVLIIEGGHYLEQVYRVALVVDVATGALNDAKVETIDIAYPVTSKNPVKADPKIAALVKGWEQAIEEKLGTVIGYTKTGVDVGPGMYSMVTDAWLAAYPRADVALSNTGAFRQNLPPGEITLADVVAVLPFENTLVIAKVSGKALLQNLACCGGAVAGLTYELRGGLVTAWLSDGRPLDPSGHYQVLINSFMYGGGDGYLFGAQDPEAEDTSIHWRDPVIGWIQRQKTTREKPLEALLEERTRFRPLPRSTEGAPAE